MIIFKARSYYNTKNSNISSVNKDKQNQISLSSNKNIDKPIKGETNVAKETKIEKDGTLTSGISNNQAVVQEKSKNNDQAVKAEEALVSDGKKVAFLTFDDGPATTVTPRVLDILKQYNIKGTFFVLGANVEQDEVSKGILKRIFEEGNGIGNHSYTHNLSKLYPHNKVDVDYFMQEVDKTNIVLKDVLGQEFETRIVRMPGGHISREYYQDPNLPIFDAKLKEKNLCSVDWNAYNADSEGKWKSASQLLNEIKATTIGKEKVIILMHDTYGKEETAKALPKIIEHLKSEGYEFKTLK